MQRDYILRQIEMLGAILRRIRDLIVRGAMGEAASELSLAARKAGVDLVLAKSLSAESLVGLLSIGAEPDAARCLLYAELLYVDGLRAEAEGMVGEARDAFAKALLLIETAGTVTPITTADLATKVADLQRRLGGAAAEGG